MSPEAIRSTVAAAYRKGIDNGAPNLAMFRAQIHEEEAVQTLVNLFRDEKQPAPLRRQCALDVVMIARGPILPWAHSGKTIEVHAPGTSGASVGDEIEVQRKLSALNQQLDELVRQNIPPAEWPEDVRLAAGDLVHILDLDGAAEEID